MIEAMLPALEMPPTPNFLSYMAVGVFTFAYVNFAPGKLHTFRLYRPKLVGGLQSSCEKKKVKQHEICGKFVLKNNNSRRNHNLALAVNAPQAKGKLSSCSNQQNPKYRNSPAPFLESSPWKDCHTITFSLENPKCAGVHSCCCSHICLSVWGKLASLRQNKYKLQIGFAWQMNCRADHIKI